MDNKDNPVPITCNSTLSSVQFYHLTTSPLIKALPKLLERAVAGGYRVCLVAESDAVVEQLNQLLWTYDPSSFLPHGSDKEDHPENQPILLSTNIEPFNSASLLVVTDGRMVNSTIYERILDIFDGNDQQATTFARERWKKYKNTGCEITYFSQNEQGKWQKKA